MAIDDGTRQLLEKCRQCLIPLRDEEIGDFWYNVRDRAGEISDGPRCTAYGQACAMIKPLIAAIEEKLDEE